MSADQSRCTGIQLLGHVVGMMSLGPFRQRQIYSALHIQHVLDVIPKDDVKPKPIKLLKTWVDPLPSSPDQSNRISQLLNQVDSPMGSTSTMERRWPNVIQCCCLG